jgi:hypothetical protein
MRMGLKWKKAVFGVMATLAAIGCTGCSVGAGVSVAEGEAEAKQTTRQVAERDIVPDSPVSRIKTRATSHTR